MNTRVKVALIDGASGAEGAGARDIWQGLRDDPEVDLALHVPAVTSAMPSDWRPITGRATDLLGKLRRRAARRGFVDYTPYEYPVLHHGIRGADIVHAHDIATQLAPLSLHFLARRRRVIWSLRDLSAITGGCSFPIACEAWRQACGPCPMLDHWPLEVSKDVTGAMQARRLRILQAGRLDLVVPATWLAERIGERAPGLRVRVIPDGVDLDLFRPGRKPRPEQGPARMLMVADGMRDIRHGGPHIVDIRSHLERRGRSLELLMAGSGAPGEVIEMGPLTLRHLGRLEGTDMAAACGSADALLLPALADPFPRPMLAALACGLPVFAFEHGGIGEAIDEGVGALRPAGDIGGLIDAFLTARDSGRLPGLGLAARERACARYSMEGFLEAHRALYRGAP